MKYHGWFKPQHDLEYARRALKAGLDGFEIIGGQSHYDPVEFKRYRENIKRIQEELPASFTLHAPITDINLGSINRRIRQASIDDVKAALEFALEIGGSAVAVHASPGILAMPGGRWSQDTESPAVQDELIHQEQLLLEALRELAGFAPEIPICLENLVYPHELYRSPREMRELLEKVGCPNVQATLDVGHAVVSGWDPVRFVHDNFETIRHVHLHDNHGFVDEHLPLGQGTIDYLHVIKALQQHSYEGVITFEFYPESPERFADYLRQFS
jgi:sugar phosphate isomerase/epimerase